MMNCKTARRYLYAFADGELPVKDNCEVLDHLKMCPECTRVASEQQALRTALRRAMNRTPVPEGLADRMAAKLDRRPEPAPVVGRRWWRLGVPMAAAASVAFAVTAVWMMRPVEEQKPGVPIPGVQTGGGDVALRDVIKIHEYCCERHNRHQNKQLPDGLKGLAKAMEAHFNNLLDVLAPDFDSSGYAFESANYCGFTKNKGAHLIYVTKGETPKRLSFFSVPRWSSIDACGYYQGVGDSFLRRFRAPHAKPRYAIVAWHDNQTTYVCCAELSAVSVDQMAKMVEPVRTAMRTRSERLELALSVARFLLR